MDPKDQLLNEVPDIVPSRPSEVIQVYDRRSRKRWYGFIDYIIRVGSNLRLEYPTLDSYQPLYGDIIKKIFRIGNSGSHYKIIAGSDDNQCEYEVQLVQIKNMTFQ